ncbi:MAG: alanine--tRNA ligase, partial [Campylobacteraceae bacterium]|nr:alanine--tRNA ligase [Campylobacteraceae bacterium]
EAVWEKTALELTKSWRETLVNISEVLKHKDPLIAIEKLKAENKTLKNEIDALESQSGKDVQIQDINGVKIVIDELKAGDIKKSIDDFKNRYENAAIILFQNKDEKVLIAAGAKNCAIKAGEWIREIAPIIGGGGGGRDDFAQAGGKDLSKIEEAKGKALDYVKAILKG